MYNVILQPIGSKKEAKSNYNSTVYNGIEINKIKPFLNQKDFEILSQIYKNKLVRVWGITSGPRKTKYWESIKEGDIALFSGDKQISLSAIVTYKLRNSELADYLWKKTKKNEEFEYVYFIDEIKDISINLSTFNTLLNYEVDGNSIQGFRILGQKKAEKIMEAFKLHDLFGNSVSVKEELKQSLGNIVSELERYASLDGEIRGMYRKEQDKLRKYLLGAKEVGNCGICGEQFPVDFLVAAHIKKRSSCTLEEKRDIKHIAIPMCKFGCDELFERGYISVLDGKVVSLVENTRLPRQVKRYIENIEGKICEYNNQNREKYFLWHYNIHKKYDK